MIKFFRIFFTILCAICLAALYPVGVFLDFPFVFGLIAIGGTSFLLMLWCRKKQLTAEQQQTPPAPQGDFFKPLETKEAPQEAPSQTDTQENNEQQS